MHLVCAVVVILTEVGRIANGFIPLRSSITVVPPPPPLYAVTTEDDDTSSSSSLHASSVMSRNRFFISAVATTSTIITPLTIHPQPSYALVKGNTPPPPKKKPSTPTTSSDNQGGGTTDGSQSPIPKCRNVEECQEMAERLADVEARQDAERAANSPKPKTVGVGGRTKYLDVVDSTTAAAATTTTTTTDDDQAVVAKLGDTATIHYKVLKIGKRSYDGLSGEGTVVFSRGYALEDDEKLIGDHNFTFTIGDVSIIQALNDAIPGMTVSNGSDSVVRRISITPRNGWEKNTNECDGGPGGRGAGGNIKVDYAIVPTATMVDQEACFDRTKLPFPTTYAQERRMAQRFDQSLIMEVRLVGLSSSS